MTEQELRGKIVSVLTDEYVTDVYGCEVNISGKDAERIADALIAEGIGDVSEWKDKATAAELVARAAANTAIERIEEYKHRAEVAELVVKNLNDIFTFDYQIVFEQAEKEFQEERKE